MFSRHGFESVTVADIAGAIGVSRRTLFRYYPSKNDIVWGEFDAELARLAGLLRCGPSSERLAQAIRRAVVQVNNFDAAELPRLRLRMTLITTVPALQAHSMLRYRQWRDLIAEFAAERLGVETAALLPQVIGHVTLGVTMAAVITWVQTGDDRHVSEVIDQALALAGDGFGL
jgi:mycofactocin system transcriptional regulator